MTLKLAADGKMHFYKTGTTIDMVPPYAASLVTGFIVTGRGSSDVLIVDSMAAGASSIAIDHATLSILHDNAISAGTNVTVSGGILNFNGHCRRDWKSHADRRLASLRRGASIISDDYGFLEHAFCHFDRLRYADHRLILGSGRRRECRKLRRNLRRSRSANGFRISFGCE